MRDKTNIKRKIQETVQAIGAEVDLPPQALPGFSHVELWQNRQAVIDGVKGVLSYSEDRIEMNLGSLVLQIRGADLSIRSYQLEQISLTGQLLELSFTSY